ncbi:hypothetical protein [Streptomyces chrestomyceticus]|uniref:hypothetical protein n=1 Tax=Streptomyces chrestomyceticus TaxID=68185 RepID=UPI0033E890DA
MSRSAALGTASSLHEGALVIDTVNGAPAVIEALGDATGALLPAGQATHIWLRSPDGQGPPWSRPIDRIRSAPATEGGA